MKNHRVSTSPADCRVGAVTTVTLIARLVVTLLHSAASKGVVVRRSVAASPADWGVLGGEWGGGWVATSGRRPSHIERRHATLCSST